MGMSDTDKNEAVARKLGWTIDKTSDYLPWYGKPNGRPESGMVRELPDYVHDIKAALEIVQWLHENGGKLLWKDYFALMASGNGWCCRMRMNPWEHADTAPMAIVEAFLKLP